MKAFLDKLDIEIHLLYRQMFEHLIQQLRENGYECRPVHEDERHTDKFINPMDVRKPDRFHPNHVEYCHVSVEIDGHLVEFGINLVDRNIEAKVDVWDNITSSTQRRLMRWYQKEWEEGIYSRYRQITTKLRAPDIKALIDKVKRRIVRSEKLHEKRKEEVANGKGTKLYW